ncbi:hypothetical protein [Streptomyces sp. NPDC051569]|uniref:hypothetical protein n=1 Tax=Streptomyces sp. NPDC051569 TaxID=3365661 RepID=UPI00378DEB76
MNSAVPAATEPDALAEWRRIRGEIPWPDDQDVIGRPGRGTRDGVRDGVRDFFTATRGPRDPAGTARVLTALTRVRADAASGRPLTFSLLAGWQCVVLGVESAGFRRGPAYAKGGRERYGMTPDVRPAFERCLAESTRPGLRTAARAARAYLDVLFFHPFDDGNAPAAMLALTFVLAREDVHLGQAHALGSTRWADDPEGAADLARLLGVLIAAIPRHHSDPYP